MVKKKLQVLDTVMRRGHLDDCQQFLKLPLMVKSFFESLSGFPCPFMYRAQWLISVWRVNIINVKGKWRCVTHVFLWVESQDFGVSYLKETSLVSQVKGNKHCLNCTWQSVMNSIQRSRGHVLALLSTACYIFTRTGLEGHLSESGHLLTSASQTDRPKLESQ